MKKLLFILAFLPIALGAFAQVANDDCTTPVDLGFVPTACDGTVYSNVNATLSVIGDDNIPMCANGNIPAHDVWFVFTCPDTIVDVSIILEGIGAAGLENPQIALYRGDCTYNDLYELLCVQADPGETSLTLDVDGLTPQTPFYIRVWDYSATATPNWGDFTLCVEEQPEITNIGQGGSTACSGMLADNGGPDGDYFPNDNDVFTICPAQPNVGCITFTLQYYHLDDTPGGFGGSDILTFYDGNNTGAPVIGQINGNGVDGGGGVCYQVQASSGCLTVQFAADAAVEFEGFLGGWQCSAQPCPPDESIALQSPITPQNIIDAVSTPATTVTITNISCEEGSYGAFSYPTDNNDLQMERGLVMTSGLISDIPGFAGTIASNQIGPFGVPDGDADLDYLSFLVGGEESNDACIVEMDVFVATDELTFEYVFGSEEYPEWVNNDFNDIFAFLVSGPGIVGDPNMNNQLNIAVLPGSNTPVEINSVNNQLNWQYFRNNEDGQSIVYDGLTSDYLGVKKTLTASFNVAPCNTYHLKLAIADRGDDVLDSGVFVSEIKGGTPNLEVLFASGIDYFIEDCSGTQDQLIISLSNPQDQPASFTTVVGGSAQLGVDYFLDLPPVITFPAGETQLTFPIYPIADALVEGTETITISLTNNFGCGTVIYKTITIDLNDNVSVNINAGADTAFVCLGGTLQLEASGAVNYFWQPAGAVSSPIIPNPTITPTQGVWLSVTGTIASCVATDSIFVQPIDPQIDVVALTPTSICLGGSTLLSANNNVAGQGLVWSPAAGLSGVAVEDPVATPTVTTTYVATISIAGCIIRDSVTIIVDTLFFPAIAADTGVCQNYPIILANDLNASSTQYAWSPATGLSDPTISNPIALPETTTTYTLTATSANGACSLTATVTVDVTAADIDILGENYIEICLGETVDLVANAGPSGPNLVNWSPSNVLSSNIGTYVTAAPTESVTVTATYLVNGCFVNDSVRIRVDSLPDLDIRLQPAKPIYCPGDTVTLLSTTYEPSLYPDIEHQWLSGLGQITPADYWNMVIRAQATDTFYRVTTNRACRDTAEAIVPVGVIPVLTASADEPIVCVGDSIQLSATVDPVYPLTWTPESGLSCVECPNPVATPAGAGAIQYIVTPVGADCPAYAFVNVQAVPRPAINLAALTEICPGASVTLNQIGAEPGVTYSWTSSPAGFSSNQAQPAVQPAVNTTYYLTANNSLCSESDTAQVNILLAALDAGIDQVICAGESAVLSANSTGTQGSFAWNPGNLSGAEISVSPTQTTVYTVVFTYGSANCVLTDQLTVQVIPGVEITGISIVPEEEQPVCEGGRVVLRVSVAVPDSTLRYTWMQNGQVIVGATADSVVIVQPAAVNGEETVWQFSVTAVNAAQCEDQSDPFSLRVIRCYGIPNAFTPDGNETNDEFKVVFLNPDRAATVVSMEIFSRWGQKVFESTPNQPNWDGNVDGKPAPVDTYVYRIVVRNFDGTNETFTGEVTLLR